MNQDILDAVAPFEAEHCLAFRRFLNAQKRQGVIRRAMQNCPAMGLPCMVEQTRREELLVEIAGEVTRELKRANELAAMMNRAEDEARSQRRDARKATA